MRVLRVKMVVIKPLFLPKHFSSNIPTFFIMFPLPFFMYNKILTLSLPLSLRLPPPQDLTYRSTWFHGAVLFSRKEKLS